MPGVGNSKKEPRLTSRENNERGDDFNSPPHAYAVDTRAFREPQTGLE